MHTPRAHITPTPACAASWSFHVTRSARTSTGPPAALALDRKKLAAFSALGGATSSERGAPVTYRYSFEDLLALLHGHAPAKVDAVALHRRRVEHGHLSVGLKIH